MRVPRSLLVLVLAALLLPWPGSTSVASDDLDGEEIVVQVSPKAIVLFATRTGNWVTVHADIPYADVDVETLLLNAVAVDFAKPDDRGDLVAKVRLTKLIGTLGEGKNILVFEGYTTENEFFFGEDMVFVRAQKGGK